ncbi:MAG: hypothetical protein AAF614_44035, partial [Chloroflexota bacterium]
VEVAPEVVEPEVAEPEAAVEETAVEETAVEETAVEETAVEETAVATSTPAPVPTVAEVAEEAVAVVVEESGEGEGEGEETAVSEPETTANDQAPDAPPPLVMGNSRGYLTTPQELQAIKAKADSGLEPYASTIEYVMEYADQDWDFNKLERNQNCKDAEDPEWNDNDGGTPILYAKAIAYHFTGNSQYAEDVKNILQRIMTEVETIVTDEQQCRLNFGWGTPEMVAAADLIEDYWRGLECTGPVSTIYDENELTTGECKVLFQNWLVKNPYYIVSFSAEQAKSNWGAAATNATAYIADYLWDRPEVLLIHRSPRQLNDGEDIARTPSEAYAYANQLALDRMNGYGVEVGSSRSCDYLSDEQQASEWEPVKSQITPDGIIPEDTRREESCNVPIYNGEYQNYPQLHIGHNAQQCELMLRRGDNSCYENIDNSDIPDFTFVDARGETRTTHLRPGRGSLERAIKAVIVDSSTEWRRDAGLAVAYRYYFNHHRLDGFEYWFQELSEVDACGQDVCFGMLTHGFAPGEDIGLPPISPAP